MTARRVLATLVAIGALGPLLAGSAGPTAFEDASAGADLSVLAAASFLLLAGSLWLPFAAATWRDPGLWTSSLALLGGLSAGASGPGGALRPAWPLLAAAAAASILLRLRSVRGVELGQYLALGILVVATTTTAGHLLDVHALHPGSSSLQAALLGMATGLGLLFARPAEALAGVMGRSGFAGRTLRWMLPVGLVAPFLVGIVQLQMRRHGLLRPEEGVFLQAVAMSLLFLAAALLSARRLEALDESRRESERRLQQSNAELGALGHRLRLATRSAGLGVWDWNLADGTLVSDERMHVLYGIGAGDRAEAFETWHGRIHPEDVTRVDADIRDALSGERDFDTDFRVIWPGGEVRHLKGHALVEAGPSGAPVRLIGVNYDVTERVRAEEQARALTATLERRVAERDAANADLEAFCYSVSHDLRQPLRAIDGFSQVLLEECAPALAEDDRTHLERIRAAAQRMGVLIDDLLSLSRIGRSRMRRRHTDLSSLARQVFDALSERQPERRIDFEVEAGLAAPADSGLMRVALENLIGNAWKFTRHAPEARISFRTEPVDGETAYCVRDNGAGFDMSYAEKLFAPFQRLHSPREFEGTGIGLAIVARVVHRHGGRVWAEGAVGRGAAFYFTLGAGDVPQERG